MCYTYPFCDNSITLIKICWIFLSSPVFKNEMKLLRFFPILVHSFRLQIRFSPTSRKIFPRSWLIIPAEYFGSSWRLRLLVKDCYESKQFIITIKILPKHWRKKNEKFSRRTLRSSNASKVLKINTRLVFNDLTELNMAVME